MEKPTQQLFNINIESATECNLLCKLILDYLPSEKCILQTVNAEGSKVSSGTTNSFRIKYPPGSFLNYRDTNYELTYAYFFYPSRHSIDGERFDLEVNLYHGVWTKSGEKAGMVVHSHYHEDVEGLGGGAAINPSHKHFHYHLNTDDEEGSPHIGGTEQDRNIITCILFNQGPHKGTRSNIFFNQFAHTKDFNDLTDDADINTHSGWNIDQLYPDRRSFFMYEETFNLERNKHNMIMLFDNVQVIETSLLKKIINKLGGTGKQGFNLKDSQKIQDEPLNARNLLYRKNIEVITDAEYKQTKREQINNLLSLTRMANFKNVAKTTREYHDISDAIYKSALGGAQTGYTTNEQKAVNLSEAWDGYARGNFIDVTLESIISRLESFKSDPTEIKDFDELNDSLKELIGGVILNYNDMTKLFKYRDTVFKDFGIEDSINDIDVTISDQIESRTYSRGTGKNITLKEDLPEDNSYLNHDVSKFLSDIGVDILKGTKNDPGGFDALDRIMNDYKFKKKYYSNVGFYDSLYYFNKDGAGLKDNAFRVATGSQYALSRNDNLGSHRISTAETERNSDPYMGNLKHSSSYFVSNTIWSSIRESGYHYYLITPDSTAGSCHTNGVCTQEEIHLQVNTNPYLRARNKYCFSNDKTLYLHTTRAIEYDSSSREWEAENYEINLITLPDYSHEIYFMGNEYKKEYSTSDSDSDVIHKKYVQIQSSASEYHNSDGDENSFIDEYVYLVKKWFDDNYKDDFDKDYFHNLINKTNYDKFQARSTGPSAGTEDNSESKRLLGAVMLRFSIGQDFFNHILYACENFVGDRRDRDIYKDTIPDIVERRNRHFKDLLGLQNMLINKDSDFYGMGINPINRLDIPRGFAFDPVGDTDWFPSVQFKSIPNINDFRYATSTSASIVPGPETIEFNRFNNVRFEYICKKIYSYYFQDQLRNPLARKRALQDLIFSRFINNSGDSYDAREYKYNFYEEDKYTDNINGIKFSGVIKNFERMTAFYRILFVITDWDEEYTANLDMVGSDGIRVPRLYDLLNEEGKNNTKLRLFQDIWFYQKNSKAKWNFLEPNMPDKLGSKFCKFLFKGLAPQMNRTIDNEECQPWFSHQMHQEGSLWKFWEKPLKLVDDNNSGFKWNNGSEFSNQGEFELSRPFKQSVIDGLIRYDKEGKKWVTHNFCRNPGGTGAAPWCYTKNPNKRWNYCSEPSYTKSLSKFLLAFIIIVLIIMSYYTVKILFKEEIPMKIVASMTGATFSSKAVTEAAKSVPTK